MVIHFHAAKTTRGHTDDREWIAFHRNDFAKYARIAPKAPLPEVIAQHCEGMRMRCAIIAVGIETADRRLYAQHFEIVAGDKLPLRRFRPVARTGAECHLIYASPAEDAAEQIGTFADLQVQRIGGCNRSPTRRCGTTTPVRRAEARATGGPAASGTS